MGGGVGGDQAIQSEDVCWLTSWERGMDMAQFGPGRFLPDAGREATLKRAQDKMRRSAQEEWVSPDGLWVNSLQTMLLDQPTAETSII